ncbi:flagellar assembly protein FliW [Sulfuricella denitrificans skB26]|uniref:Flagellar assembly factor FliW n=1 Tax=Sulfuricella denitrificans (strain DSM 22764 / NBRC 105220 / skB26) TaxID=1163617 RepID=S6AEV2_SULDS|nr:flagellar assembly protein FliW [Sulfuricella denitrificans]BAN34346.1 flagellar assembly protein FliW [Sulfuricella denitrificans skB26]
MKFHSTQFGTQEVDPESILTFPNGMPGFEGSTRYKLFHIEENTEQPVVVHWLQSIDEPDVAFALVDPALFGLNYEFVLTDEEEQLLKMESVEDIAVLLMAYKPEPDAVSKASINANINGPIVLNMRARLGLQKILVGLEADITLKSKKPAA